MILLLVHVLATSALHDAANPVTMDGTNIQPYEALAPRPSSFDVSCSCGPGQTSCEQCQRPSCSCGVWTAAAHCHRCCCRVLSWPWLACSAMLVPMQKRSSAAQATCMDTFFPATLVVSASQISQVGMDVVVQAELEVLGCAAVCSAQHHTQPPAGHPQRLAAGLQFFSYKQWCW